jgi:hypothetical protein
MSGVRNALAGVRMMIMIMRFTYRFWTGRPLSGERKTDATFFRPATRSLDPSGTALRWEMQRGAARLAWRVAGLYGVAVSFACLLLWPLSATLGDRLAWYLRPSVIISVHCVSVISAISVWAARRHLREKGLRLRLPVRTGGEWEMRSWEIEGRRTWETEVSFPLARALAPLLQRSTLEREMREWVTVPRNFRDEGGAPVEILLPHTFAGQEKARATIVSVAGEKLNLRTPGAAWQLEGSSPRLLLTSPSLPPEKLSFAEILPYMDTEEYRPFLGMISAEKALNAEMVGDSPHVGISAGPGAGKSTLAKLIAAQCLRWGWGVIILDWKKTEAYKWAIGLPGVTYITDIEDIHDAGVRLGQEVDSRKNEGLTGRAKVLVIRDEWNATADLLMAYWQDLRALADPEEKKTMPVKSPALRGFMALDFAGREFGLHDLLIAQRFSGRIFNGNTDMRECFQIRCLSRYSHQTKTMLVGNMKPFPKKSNIPGRWTIVAGEDVEVVQVPLITGDEAREWAQGGIPNPVTPLSSSYYPELGQQGVTSVTTRNTQGEELPERATAGSESSPHLDGTVLESVHTLKLRDFVDMLEAVGITYKILQHARDNERAFPPAYGGNQFSGYTYEVEAVKEWARKRHAAQRAEKEIKA